MMIRMFHEMSISKSGESFMNMHPIDLHVVAKRQERQPLGPVMAFVESVFRILGRRQQRRALRELDDRQLYDVGITRAQVEREARKPFWKS
jgi:uncharacterized protein YjiS (DUF1127 family)